MKAIAVTHQAEGAAGMTLAAGPEPEAAYDDLIDPKHPE